MYCRELKGTIGVLVFVVSLLLAAGVTAADIDDTAPSVKCKKLVTSGPVRYAAIAGRGMGGEQLVAHDLSSLNEKVSATDKEQPKTKKIVLGVTLAVVLAFVLINVYALGHTIRICTSCGYTGSMKAVTLCVQPVLNALLIILVGMLPVLRLYFSERGLFLCPQCGRTGTNVTVHN